MTRYKLTDRDRGAVLVLRLLLRADEVHEGEEEWRTTADDIANAVEREGLPATIRFQMDAERDFMVSEGESVTSLYGRFPQALARVAREAPKTVWKGPLTADIPAGESE